MRLTAPEKARALFGKDSAAGRRQAVIAPAPPARGFPFAFDPAAPLEAIKQWIQRRHVKAEHALGARGDEFADFVAVAGFLFEKRKDEQLGVAFFEFSVRHNRHIWLYYISARDSQWFAAFSCPNTYSATLGQPQAHP